MRKLYNAISLQLLALIFLTVSTYGCADFNELSSGNLNVIHEKTFATQSGKSLILKASSGDVEVKPTDKSEVYIKILGNEKAEKHIHFSFNNDENGVEINAEREGGWNLFSWGNNIKLKFLVMVPKEYNLKITSSGGDINFYKLNGDMIIKTSGGDVSGADINGSVQVKTSGGDVEFDNCTGDLTLSTSGGDITCSEINGNLYTHSSGGDLTINVNDGKVDASTSGGDIKLDYRGNNKGINLSSSGGDIYVKVPSDFNAHADLKSSGDDIDCNLKGSNVTRMSSNVYEADINSGGELLKCKTSGGSIVIRN